MRSILDKTGSNTIKCPEHDEKEFVICLNYELEFCANHVDIQDDQAQSLGESELLIHLRCK